MASFDTLPADQRAVLELVLRLGRSYDEIAQLLSLDRDVVRERAVAALDALGPQTRVSPERRALITDYLLGALPDGAADEVRRRLGQSASERAWARVVASELHEISDGPMPEIPAAAPPPSAPSAVLSAVPEAAAPTEPVAAPASAPDDAPVRAAFATEANGSGEHEEAPAPEPSMSRRSAAPPGEVPPPPPPRRSSRRGGAILLAGGALVVAAVIAVVVVTGGGGGAPPQASATTPAATTAPSSTATTSTTGAQVVSQINLKPPGGGSSPVGIAEVLRERGKIGIAIIAQGLAPNTKSPANAYAVWLSNSPTDSRILGFVNPAVGSSGRLQTAGGLPSNASHYHQLLITLETQSNPRTPGTIVLKGPLSGV
jgi:hypothetical protein